MSEDTRGKNICVGNDMIELIEEVGKQFEDKYGFKPTIIDITNMIAKRVIQNKLF